MSEQSREAAIRLVVAVQWGEAIAFTCTWGVQRVDVPGYRDPVDDLAGRWPCAVDVVDALWPRGEV